MSQILIDPQAAGWQEDYSESGAVRTRGTRPPLVRVPFRPTNYRTEVNGAGTGATYVGTIRTNRDGSGSGINCTVGAGLAGGGIRIWFEFWGRVFGLRARRMSAPTACNLSVSVDGEPFPVDFASSHLVAEGLTVLQDDEACWVAPAILDEGLHMAEILIYNEASAKAILLYGLLLDAELYPERTLVSHTTTAYTAALTAAQVEVPYMRNLVDQFRGISEILYTNTDAVNRTVTVKINATVAWQKTLAAGESASLQFKTPVAPLSTLLTHAADVAGVVNATVLGVY